MIPEYLKEYRFYDRRRCEYSGETVYNLVASATLDSDAQAELMVNHLRDDGLIPTDNDGNPKRGLTIKRTEAEWYSRGV